LNLEGLSGHSSVFCRPTSPLHLSALLPSSIAIDLSRRDILSFFLHHHSLSLLLAGQGRTNLHCRPFTIQVVRLLCSNSRSSTSRPSPYFQRSLELAAQFIKTNPVPSPTLFARSHRSLFNSTKPLSELYNPKQIRQLFKRLPQVHRNETVSHVSASSSHASADAQHQATAILKIPKTYDFSIIYL
jgi:hypothetical protein